MELIIFHGVEKSQTQLSDFHFQILPYIPHFYVSLDWASALACDSHTATQCDQILFSQLWEAIEILQGPNTSKGLIANHLKP